MPHKSAGLARSTGAGLKTAWLAQYPVAVEAEVLSVFWSVQMCWRARQVARTAA